MLVGYIDVLLVLLTGILSAILYRHLRRRSENLYLGLTVLVTALFWLHTAVANLWSVGYWWWVGGCADLPAFLGSLYVLSLPLWFRLGGELTFVLVGRQRDQGGLIWVFRLSDRTEPIQPAWRTPYDAEYTVDEVDDS